MVERPSNDIKQLWLGQETANVGFTLEELRHRDEKFRRRVRNRNLREYLAAAFVVPVFAFYIWFFPNPLMKAGSVLVILGTLFVVWQLHRRGSARKPPLEASLLDLMEFHRRELARQRDALRSVWLWYLAPLVPGLALTLFGVYRQSGRSNALMLTIALAVLVFAATWLLNRWGAARLQRRIEALERMKSEQRDLS